MLAKIDTLEAVSTMNISLPDAMKEFVDEQVAQKGYGSCSEYVRDLIRKEQDREKLRSLLLEGLQSGPGRVIDAAYSDELHARIRRHAAAGKAEQPPAAKAKRASKAGAN